MVYWMAWHCTIEYHMALLNHQHKFFYNIWTGIGDFLIGPVSSIYLIVVNYKKFIINLCVIRLQHILVASFESFWIIIITIDEHWQRRIYRLTCVLLIWTLWTFIYGHILKLSLMIFLLLLWKYFKIVLSLRVTKYLENFQTPSAIHEMWSTHWLLQKEILLSNFFKEIFLLKSINKKYL